MTTAHCTSRRWFLAGSIAAIGGMNSLGIANDDDVSKKTTTVDMHLHLFGNGDSGSGCRLSDAIMKGPLFELLAKKLRIRQRGKTMDEGYVHALAAHLNASKLDKGVVLAQDAAYDRNGKPNWDRTPFYVPNDYLLKVTTQHSKKMVPCIGINPQRRDAIEELERCQSKGARVLKIHPPIQGVDLSLKQYAPFFQRCAELEFIVMVHTGHEHSSPIVNAEFANPRRLTIALENACTVVACHSGTGWPTDAVDMLPDFLAMIRKYKNLWGDTAVLGSAGRVRDLSRLLADDTARSRLLHGSDFPFPATPLAFLAKVGVAKAARLQATENLIDRDFDLKDALGIGSTSAIRAHRLINTTDE